MPCQRQNDLEALAATVLAGFAASGKIGLTADPREAVGYAIGFALELRKQVSDMSRIRIEHNNESKKDA